MRNCANVLGNAIFLSSCLLLSLKGCYFPQTNEIKAACLDVFAFPSIYQPEHLVHKGNGLLVGMHKSAIPQRSLVTSVLQQREKHGGQNGISLCVPPLFSRLESLPPKHVYHDSQTQTTDTFICLNIHPTLSFFHPTIIIIIIQSSVQSFRPASIPNHLSICLSIYPSLYLSTHSSPSMYPSIHPPSLLPR